MTTRKHAMLSASGASRWLICTPSARLEEEFPEMESDYADEGTFAHAVGEIMIKERLYGIDLGAHLARLRDSEDGEKYWNEELLAYCFDYAEFVANKVREAPPGAILIQESRLNLQKYIPEGFGTTDNTIIADNVLEVIDMKYGKGIPVDSFENKQLMIYGLGALEEYSILYNIEKVILTIYQPRIDNTSSYEISADDLRRWGSEVLQPIALKAFQGLGDFIPGDHCQFCRVRSTCKANAELNLRLAAREFDPPTLKDEQLVKIVMASQRIKKWLSAVEAYALQRALEGYQWPGMKVVIGRSVRKYRDPEKVIQALISAGYNGEQVVNKKPLGITEMQKKIAKLHFKEIVEPLLEKPPGKPTLVTEDDPRAPYDPESAATAEFTKIEDEQQG